MTTANATPASDKPREPAIEVGPIADIPWAQVDLNASLNPLPAILEAAEFAETKRYFADSPSSSRSMLSLTEQALLFTLIRNQQPDHVVEIGTYKGGTAEVLSRAVQANGRGRVHTVSPYDVARFHPIYTRWPEPLRKTLRYYPMDSMSFLMQIDEQKIRPGLVLIDGNHDYEFANFDLQASASRMARGGFVFVTKVGQAGPHLAVQDFIRDHPEWHDCRVISPSGNATKAFDPDRTTIPDADLVVLRAPSSYFTGSRPMTFGENPWSEPVLRGLRLSVAGTSRPGTLYVQCILRVFSDQRIDELVGETSRAIDGTGEIDIVFDRQLQSDLEFTHCRVEPWLIWTGSEPLALSRPPEPY